jgi:hypothetical protein
MRIVGTCSECKSEYSEHNGPVHSLMMKKFVCSECAYCRCHDERQKLECEDFMREYAEDMRADIDMDR